MTSQDKTKIGGRSRDAKSRCVYCRKCYNSGLCMMPWPGLPASESKKAFVRGGKKA
jgi:hypothetical protein